MPEGMTPQGAAAPAQAGAASPPPQAGGAGGATMPTPNQGLAQAAMARLAVAVQAIQAISAVLPAGSDEAKAIREALNKLAPLVPPGGISPGVQMSEAQRALMQQRQGPAISAMRQQQGAVPQPTPPPQM